MPEDTNKETVATNAVGSVPASPAPAPSGNEAVQPQTGDVLTPLSKEDAEKMKTAPAGTSVSHFERTGPAEIPPPDEKLVQKSMSDRERQLKNRRNLAGQPAASSK